MSSLPRSSKPCEQLATAWELAAPRVSVLVYEVGCNRSFHWINPHLEPDLEDLVISAALDRGAKECVGAGDCRHDDDHGEESQPCKMVRSDIWSRTRPSISIKVTSPNPPSKGHCISRRGIEASV